MISDLDDLSSNPVKAISAEEASRNEEELSNAQCVVAVPTTSHRMNFSAVGRENTGSCMCTCGVVAVLNPDFVSAVFFT